jgi:hypothetical protein
MAEDESSKRAVLFWSEAVAIFVLLAIVFWVSRYWYSARFGLYEDDYTIIPAAVNMTGGQLVSFIINYIVHLNGHARPLSNSFIYLFSFLGWKLGGLSGIYRIGFAIVTINAVLFYWLLRRLHNRAFALIGALAYCLFSADTTQAFLTHSLGLQPSLTLLLLAFHSYLSDKRWLTYLLALVILFSYETPFPLLFAAPLFEQTWDSKLFKRIVKHAILLGCLLLGVFLLRFFTGEGRVSSLSAGNTLITIFLHMIEGPLVSLSMYVYRPIELLRNLDFGNTMVVVLVFAGLCLILSRIKPENVIPIRETIVSLKSQKTLAADPEIKAIIQLAVAGIVMLVLAYPLTLTVRAYAISGRDTRVHFAAVIGASFLVACLGTILFEASAAFGKKGLGVLILAGFFSLLAGYGFVVQKDYVLSWEYQKQFWTQVIQLMPDVQDGTIILVEPPAFQDTKQIGANSWNLPRLLAGIYDYPKEWSNPPSVYRLIPGWQNHIVGSDGLFQLNETTTSAAASLYKNVKAADVIMIQSNQKILSRSPASL